MELIKNNKIIRLLRCINILSGIEFTFESAHDKIMLKMVHSNPSAEINRTFDIPYSFRNQLLVHSYYNSTEDNVIINTEFLVRELLKDFDQDSGERHVKDRYLEEIASWITQEDLGIRMINNMFNDQDKFMVPGLITEFLRDIQFFDEKNNIDYWLRVENELKRTSPGANIIYASSNLIFSSNEISNKINNWVNRSVVEIGTDVGVLNEAAKISGYALAASAGKIIGTTGYVVGSMGNMIGSLIRFEAQWLKSKIFTDSERHTFLVEKRKTYLQSSTIGKSIIELVNSVKNSFNLLTVSAGLSDVLQEYQSESKEILRNLGSKIKLTYIDYNTQLIIENYKYTRKYNQEKSIVSYLQDVLKEVNKLLEIKRNVPYGKT